jgi:hypothetical protein
VPVENRPSASFFNLAEGLACFDEIDSLLVTPVYPGFVGLNLSTKDFQKSSKLRPGR